MRLSLATIRIRRKRAFASHRAPKRSSIRPIARWSVRERLCPPFCTATRNQAAACTALLGLTSRQKHRHVFDVAISVILRRDLQSFKTRQTFSRAPSLAYAAHLQASLLAVVERTSRCSKPAAHITNTRLSETIGRSFAEVRKQSVLAVAIS